MEKMTKKDMFTFIKSIAQDYEDVIAFCDNEIALLDKKASKAKESAAKKKAQGDPLKTAVAAVLSKEQFEPISVIAARVPGEDITVSKVTYRLTSLVKEGFAEKKEISITEADKRKRTVMGYKAC